VPNDVWRWEADGNQVPADAYAHHDANERRAWNEHFYREDNEYLDEPLYRDGIKLTPYWNGYGERTKYWNGQGQDPLNGALPLGTDLNARRRAHKGYAQHLAQQRVQQRQAQEEAQWQEQQRRMQHDWGFEGADDWSGGKKRVNKSRRVSNRRRRNKSIRRRKN